MFALVDCNSFYASCERVFRPDLKDKPIVVLSNNDGCVVALTKEVKEIGIKTALSFLPVCHVFERVQLYGYLYHGIAIYFAESLETIGENLKEIKPQIMSAVPRLLEKLYDKLYAKGHEFSGLKRSLYYWAVNIALKYEPYGKNGIFYSIKHSIAKKLI